MRPVALWCVALVLCGAVLVANGRRAGGSLAAWASTASMGADTARETHALDLQTTPPEALQGAGPHTAIGGSTVITAHPSSTSSDVRRASVRLGSRSSHLPAGARSSPPLRAIPLLI
jgi:hypothetical protein